MLHKYESVYIKVLKLHISYIKRTYIGVVRGPLGHGPSKFLEYLVILCFNKQYLKQNTVVRLKLNILTHQKFWAGHATAHVSIYTVVSFG